MSIFYSVFQHRLPLPLIIKLRIGFSINCVCSYFGNAMDVTECIFPLEVKKIYNNSAIYLKRETVVLGAEFIKSHPAPFAIKYEALNQEYINYKERNGLEVKRLGKVLSFDHGRCCLDQTPLGMNNCNFFGEGLRYVIDEHGKTYIPDDDITHEKILGGQYIICAGMLKFNENSKIVYLDNHTGHYLASDYHLHQATLILGAQDMLAPDVVIKIWGKDLIHDYSQFLKLEFKAPDTIMQLDIEEGEPDFLTSRRNYIVPPTYSRAHKYLHIMFYLQELNAEEHKLKQMKERKMLGPRPKRLGGIDPATVVTGEMLDLQLQRVKTIKEKGVPYGNIYEEFEREKIHSS